MEKSTEPPVTPFSRGIQFIRVRRRGRFSMRRRRGPRFKNGLPRGGLGRVGWVPCLGSFAAAWFVRADLALWVGLLAVPVCIWCALGLRKDDAAGEVPDHYVDDESWDWKELLSGNIEHPVRRQSNVMVALGVLACVIAWCRWWFGWGPFA
jgi:hypothetical protein